LIYQSGTWKKAELRNSKKESVESASISSGLYFPPGSVKDPVSGGLNVELGFKPYTERLNRRIAVLELVVFLQIYFTVVVSAMFVNSEKEKVSTV
ncbi:unnamed protein product, partial [Brassica rapa]